MIKRIFFVILALAVIGALAPNSSEGNSANTDIKTENAIDKEEEEAETDLEEAEENESEEKADKQEAVHSQDSAPAVVYSKDTLANGIIIRYNLLNPDNPVTPDMVENWVNGAMDDATNVFLEDMTVKFGYADGNPNFECLSDREYNSDNRNEFVEESMYWIRATYDFVEGNTADKLEAFLKRANDHEYYEIGDYMFWYDEDSSYNHTNYEISWYEMIW